MKQRKVTNPHVIAFAASLVLLWESSIVVAQPAAQPKPLQISMAKTFVRDQPKILVDILAGEFAEVMKETTGLKGDLSVTYTPAEVAARIDAKQLDFGILHAHEFAWLRAKYPELSPFLITKEKDKHVYLLVHKDSPAKSIADLRGKKLDLPRGSKEYCRIYIDKLCANKAKSEPAKFFGSLAKSGSQVEALDQVARRKADATVIDTVWLDFYKHVKGPVFEKNLRVLQKSGVVPPAVIIHRKKGALDEATVDRVRAGLLKSHNTTRGRLLMAMWNIESFEAVPKDYGKRLDHLLKEYPAP